MKTRIIHTKIWEDDFFINLDKQARYFFLYLITNTRINLCGIYELPNRIILFETGFNLMDIKILKKALAPKVYFYNNFVYIVNSNKLGGYKGIKNEKACANELEKIPEKIKKALFKQNTDRVSIGYIRGIDTSINHKSEIINNKSGGSGGKFEPPNLLEVKEYFKEKGFSESIGEKAFSYYEANNWKDAKGNKVKSWKQKMIGVWFKDENKIKKTNYEPHY